MDRFHSNVICSAKRKMKCLWLTLKKVAVDWPRRVPYLMAVCLARSSTELMGELILAAVRNAARLAVYDDIIISVNKYHTLATIRDDIALSREDNYIIVLQQQWVMSNESYPHSISLTKEIRFTEVASRSWILGNFEKLK